MSGRPAVDIHEDVWLRFLDDAVRGLRGAARRMNEPERRVVLEGRPGWFGLPNRAAGDARLPDETSISQALVETMRQTQAAQFLKAPALAPGEPDLTRMDFAVEVGREFDPAIGPRARPTDIQIAIFRDRIDLRVEAKKLTTPGDIAADYLGASGLERFDDVDAPYTLERFGAMMAYVTDRDASAWSDLIATGLRTVLPPERLGSMMVAGEELATSTHVRDVDISVHGVKGRYRTDVMHIVAEFEASPTRRMPRPP